ncbi:MAG: HypC/HybG/HupF family hydrogenase formation chaperone, partial [Plesiomonas shigelloides]
MCIGIPSRVLSVNGQLACVDSFGQQREVSLLLLDEPVNVGDYLLVQVGGFAASRMSA